MPKKPTKYILLQIGYAQYLLPGSTNLNTLIGAFSKALRVRSEYRRTADGGVYYYPEDDGGTEFEIKMINSSSVYAAKQQDQSEEEDAELPQKRLGQGNLRLL